MACRPLAAWPSGSLHGNPPRMHYYQVSAPALSLRFAFTLRAVPLLLCPPPQHHKQLVAVGRVSRNPALARAAMGDQSLKARLDALRLGLDSDSDDSGEPTEILPRRGVAWRGAAADARLALRSRLDALCSEPGAGSSDSADASVPDFPVPPSPSAPTRVPPSSEAPCAPPSPPVPVAAPAAGVAPAADRACVAPQNAAASGRLGSLFGRANGALPVPTRAEASSASLFTLPGAQPPTPAADDWAALPVVQLPVISTLLPAAALAPGAASSGPAS